MGFVVDAKKLSAVNCFLSEEENMILGHYAVGLAAKKWAPKTSLGTLLAAALWLNLVWTLFCLLGLERFNISPGIIRMMPLEFNDYALSHSLVMALAWGVGFALVMLILGKGEKTAWITGGLVFSAWVLDYLVHRPDLAFTPAYRNKFLGLGLWNYAWISILLEVIFFAGGIWLYLKSTKALNNKGRIGFWAGVAVLAVLYLVVAYLGGHPYQIQTMIKRPLTPFMVVMASLIQFAFVGWGYWIDRHRKAA
jgi:hypothetical protein